MNKHKWKSKDIPLQTLALKLCEEAAEVGTELTDLMIVEDGRYEGERNLTRDERRAIMEELEHVSFIASVIRSRLR